MAGPIRYREPISLPEGTVIDMRIRYDNSADNPRNPHQPPRRVVAGPSSTDEMGNLTFELVARSRESLIALRESKYRRVVDRSAGGDANSLYNLANVLRDQNRLNEAVFEYQRALNVDPKHLWSLHNLSMLFQSMGRAEEAVELARREIAVTPKAATAHNNLGNALKLSLIHI